MMRRLILVVAALLPLASQLNAQQLTVQTGDHNGFTRLVAQIPAKAEWSVEKRGRAVEIVVPRHLDGFDTRNVFNLIKPDRIEQISSKDDRLVLNLACDCQVSAFQVDETFVAVDVASPGFELLTPAISDSAPLAPAPETVAQTNNEVAVVLPLPTRRTPEFELPLLIEPERKQTSTAPSLEHENSALLTEMRQQLARELGEAATRGILSPSNTAQANPDTSLSEIPTAPPKPRPLPDLAVQDPTQNMRVTSSNDTIISRAAEVENKAHPKASCSLGKKLNVSEWNDGNGFEVQIGAGRAGLYGEFDRLNKDGLVALAKSYLYFGFGIEAQSTLRMDPDTAAEHRYLLEIAQIIDQASPPETSQLSRLVECNNDAALWAQLAGPALAENAILNTQAALLTLNDLPSHLREILAPALADRLRVFGNLDDAAAALRSINRLPTPPRPAAQVAQAEQDIATGAPEDGAKALAAVAQDNVVEAPRALIRLIETQAETGQPVSENDIQLLDAYAREFAETQLGNDLTIAHLRGLIATDQYDHARERLALLTANNEEVRELSTQLLKAILERADDVGFLQFTFDKVGDALADLSPQDRLLMAERFLALGFAERSALVLKGFSETETDVAHSLLSARVALDLSEPFEAQAHLLNITGEEADLLRAQALSLVGQHAQAAELYRQADAQDQADRAAWLAENWQEITMPEADVFGPIAEVSARQAPFAEGIDGLLSTSSAALEESDAARKAIEALLSSTALETAAVSAD